MQRKSTDRKENPAGFRGRVVFQRKTAQARACAARRNTADRGGPLWWRRELYGRPPPSAASAAKGRRGPAEGRRVRRRPLEDAVEREHAWRVPAPGGGYT